MDVGGWRGGSTDMPLAAKTLAPPPVAAAAAAVVVVVQNSY